MKKKCLFLTALSLICFSEAFSRIADGPRWDQYPQEAQTLVFKSIVSIQPVSAFLYGVSEKYGLSEEEINTVIEKKFSDHGRVIEPISSHKTEKSLMLAFDEQEKDEQPALLNISVTAKDKMVLIETELTDRAAFLKSHVCFSTTLWKREIFLREKEGSDMKKSILFHVSNCIDEILLKCLKIQNLNKELENEKNDYSVYFY